MARPREGLEVIVAGPPGGVEDRLEAGNATSRHEPEADVFGAPVVVARDHLAVTALGEEAERLPGVRRIPVHDPHPALESLPRAGEIARHQKEVPNRILPRVEHVAPDVQRVLGQEVRAATYRSR